MGWNKMGGDKAEVVGAIGTVFRSNTTLLHLDLSNNNFNPEQSRHLKEAVRENHTLYGLHFEGNAGFVDSRGFIQLVDTMGA